VIEKFLKEIARFSYNYYKLVIVGALLLTLFTGWLAMGIRLDLGFMKLMPQDNPRMKRYVEVTDISGGIDSLVVVLKAPDLERAKQFADQLALKFKELPEVVQLIDYKIDIDFFEDHGLLYLDESDLIDIRDEIREEKPRMKRVFGKPRLVPFLTEINNRFEDYTRDQDLSDEEEEVSEGLEAMDGVLTAMAGYVDQGNKLSAEEMEEALEDYLMQGKKKEHEEDLEEEYYIPDDKSLLMMILKPTDPHHNVAFFIKMVNQVKGKVAQVQPEFSDVKVGYAGMAAMMDDEWVGIQKDMRLTGLIALVGVLLLFIFSFRMIAAPLLAGIPLIMGIVWNFGLTAATVGRLNVITSIIAAILLGLGIDFAIHIISRYGEERLAGNGIRESLEITLSQTGQGVLLGAVTTAVAFYGLMAGEFQGMTELGLIAANGVLTCLASIMLVLPALLRLKDERARVRASRPVSFAFLEKVGRAMTLKPYLVLFLGLVITAVLGYFAAQIKFEYDMMELLPKVDSVELHKEVMKKFDKGLDYALLMNADLAEVRRMSDALEEKETIKEVDSITNFLPTEQENKIPVIRSIGRELEDIKISEATEAGEMVSDAKLKLILGELERLRLNFLEISDLGFIAGLDDIADNGSKLAKKSLNLAGKIKSSPRNNLSYLEMILGQELGSTLLKFKKMTRTSTISLADLPLEIKEKYIMPDGQYLIYAFPTGTGLDEQTMAANREDLFSVDPGATGTPVIWTEVLNYIKRDINKSTILVFAAIFVMVSLSFRSFKNAIITILPVALGTVWTLGIMTLIGIKLNFSNMAAIPMILGIGIDDGVHIVHRYRFEGIGSIPLVMRSTGRAVLLTTLTTLIGFGSLGFSSDPYVASLGIALAIGVGLCFIVSVTILPAALKIFEKGGE
jgi:hopanoid biosynthesis associated RND transporter like protein HpnN